jgi:hypothetical protein
MATNDVGWIAFRALVDARWNGKQTAAASELNVSNPTISDYVNGKKGAGVRLIAAVAAIEPLVALQMMGSEPLVPAVRWAAEVAKELELAGYSRRVSGWATIQSLYLGKPQTRSDLLAQARMLAPVAVGIIGVESGTKQLKKAIGK